MQHHIESSTSIPVEIQQEAETQHLGELLAIHLHDYKTYPVSLAIGIVFFVGMLGLFAPFTFLSWTAYILILLLLGVGVYLLQRVSGAAHRRDQIALYTDGFIDFNGGTATVYRWENIEYILRGAPASEGEGISDIDRITVKAGEKTFKLDMTMSAHVRSEICDRIERNFVSAHLPQVIARYTGGEEITFGTTPADSLRVSQAGFRDATEHLPWPVVDKAEVGPALVIIRKEGRTSDWFHKLICNVPNAALLKALLEHRQYYL